MNNELLQSYAAITVALPPLGYILATCYKQFTETKQDLLEHRLNPSQIETIYLQFAKETLADKINHLAGMPGRILAYQMYGKDK